MQAKYVILHFLVTTLKKKTTNKNLLKYKHFNLVYSNYYHFKINRKNDTEVFSISYLY